MKAATTYDSSQLVRSLGIDADRIYNATVGQRSHIFQQLQEAEEDARDALFALDMMEMALAREAAAIKSSLSRLSETLPPREFEEMCEFAFGQSKKDWEDVWKHKWVEDRTERDKFVKRKRVTDGTEGDRFVKRPRGPSKNPRFNFTRAPSSPLPPSSPPPPTPPARSPLPPDGFRAPWGFVENFGSTGYRPTPTPPVPFPEPLQPQQSRRLRRDERRLNLRPDGSLVLVDPQEEIEAQREQIRQKMRFQAQQKVPAEAEISLWKIAQTKPINHIHDPPVTWSTLFELYSVVNRTPNDLTNPFAQEDHVLPTRPELYPRRPEQDEEGEQEPESGADHHVQAHHQ